MKWKDPEHKLIAEKIDILQTTLDRFYEDFRDDRRARGDMEISVKNIANTTNMIREDFKDQTTDVKRAAEDGVQEAIEPVKHKVNKLVSSKQSVVHYIEDHRKSRIRKLMFWKRG